MSINRSILLLYVFFILLSATTTCQSPSKSATESNSETKLLIAPEADLPREIIGDLGIRYCLIPAGQFLMGPDPVQVNRYKLHQLQQEPGVGYASTRGFPSTQPFHVKISRPFYLSAYEITEDQYAHYQRSLGREVYTPRQFLKRPVRNITWTDARAFCKWLTRKSGIVHALPTEAQWEYACRAGTSTTWHFGNSAERLEEFAWYTKQEGTHLDGPQAVGQKKANPFGLFDMYGNVAEFCRDYYAAYPEKAVIDPMQQQISPFGWRVVRGGDFASSETGVVSRFRMYIEEENERTPLYGFRILRAIPEEQGVIQ